jgi:hypothetical protein
MMRRPIAVAVVLVMVGSKASAQRVDGLSQLGWIAGCWELKAGARTILEQWMAPAGGLMLGMSRTVVRDTAREFEQVRIELRSGRPSYVAKPSGQAEAAFDAETVTDTMVVFANPTHDFPQRISYRRVGADSLVARIEGKQGDKVRGIDFPMRRVGCSGAGR